MIDGEWQSGDRDRRTTGVELPLLVVESNQGVLVGNEQLVADEREAVWSIEIFGKCRPQLVDAVTVAVTQQGESIAAFDGTGSLRLDVGGDHIFGRELGRVAASSFGNQDVAIRQDQRLAWDGEAGRDGADLVTPRHYRLPAAPVRRLRNHHRRQQLRLRIR